jgi:hypothetical protein
MGKDGAVTIPGLWNISLSERSIPAGIVQLAPANRLYFTAGPNNENSGLFGYLQPKPAIAVIGTKPLPTTVGELK